MTILLHDVQYLLQIPVEGRLMSRTSAQLDHPEVGLCALLGMNSEQLSGRSEVPGFGSKGKWYEKGGFLADMASRYLQVNGTHVTEAQSYLLLMLGSTLFVDKSRDRVRPVVNLFLDELEEIDQYSWASGTLAWLYRCLGQASRAGARGWLVVSHFCSVGSTSTFRVSGHLTLSHLSLDLMRLGLHDGLGSRRLVLWLIPV
ncbi:unnamed protein product [Linum tenue]|uniref:Aminotransferase-like plant mobile domain-containing protein n=1 Tax=Linum tenue TaxID=586396 RepID=A0AAV0NDR0_9ROSI|nr:unnamed protein product [Linum tenue]